jgi:hypothetical protein
MGGREGRRPAGRWRQRWYRLVIPFAVLAVLTGVTLAARVHQDPDLGDPATLAPHGTGPDGGSELAALLTARGVAIEPVDTLAQAQQALGAGRDAVLFVPKPTLFGAVLVNEIATSQAGHRIVLVAPDPYLLAVTALPVASGRQRWAAAATSPGRSCALPEALAAGTATALRNRYAAAEPEDRCYRGGLVRTRIGSGPPVYLVGATDPFRNRRIHEHGNARLAVELLAGEGRVVWAGALPTDLDLRLPRLERPPVDRTGGNAFAGLVDGYPPGVLAGLSLAALLAVLVAVARARRLGPPVSEPLPVRVPAAEAVAGRGRLYQRTRGRAVALAALREAAMPRLVRALGLPAAPPPDPETVVQAAARRTGQPVEQVRRTLYVHRPASDRELADAVAALDALVAAVTGDHPTGRTVSP